MFGYDLLDKFPGVRPDNRYASVREDHRVIAGERRDQLEALFPSWPVVELPDGVGPTIPIAEYAAAADLEWSEADGRWHATAEFMAAVRAAEPVGPLETHHTADGREYQIQAVRLGS